MPVSAPLSLSLVHGVILLCGQVGAHVCLNDMRCLCMLLCPDPTCASLFAGLPET
jgi:hypothetical protein